MNTQPRATAGRSRFWRQLLVFGRWVTEREELPRDADEPSTQRHGASPLVWLTAPDHLPNRASLEVGRRGLIPWLVSRDQLPNRSEPRGSERGFLGWVTSRENLPKLSSERAPESRSFFRWLLTSDHDRFESLHSIKEVPPNEP